MGWAVWDMHQGDSQRCQPITTGGHKDASPTIASTCQGMHCEDREQRAAAVLRVVLLCGPCP